jgi:hypothetical protein
MPGLVPGIHVLTRDREKRRGRDKPGHDELGSPIDAVPMQGVSDAR